MSEELKVCPKCHLELPVTDFAIHDKRRGYRRGHCDACERARMRKYYAEHPEYRDQVRANSAKHFKLHPKTPSQSRKHNLKQKFGLTLEQYDALLSSQGGRCALCKSESTGRDRSDSKWHAGHWNVDHCHRDKRVRGLLCHKCNVRLGAYEGLMSEVGEANVVEYLTRPSPVPPAAVNAAPVYRHVPNYVPPAFVASPCTVEGCGKNVAARGFCQKHYARFLRRAGDVGGANDLPHTSAKGAAHPKSKLTEDVVRAIRASDEKGVVLAERYRVTTTLISNVRNRKVWDHLA